MDPTSFVARTPLRLATDKETYSKDVSSSCESLELSDTHYIDEGTLSDLSVGDHTNQCNETWNQTRCRDNQDEDDASSSCSSLSVEASSQQASDEHLSLSGCTESDQAAIDAVLFSSASDINEHTNSDTDEDAKDRVLLSDEEGRDVNDGAQEADAAEASSLSGEMSSSSFEVQYIEDTDENVDEDDELWRAFDTALETCDVYEQIDPTIMFTSPLTVEDTGYDGSASEADSMSSLDNSIDDVGDEIVYMNVRTTEDQALHHRDVESLDELSSSADSSISSLASTSAKAFDTTDDDGNASSADVSSDENSPKHSNIENIPVLPGGYEQLRLVPVALDGIEQAPHLHLNEFILASTGDRRSRRQRWESNSDESLTLEGEFEKQPVHSDEEKWASLPTLLPTKKDRPVQYERLQVYESYVAFTDLAGLIDAHVPRRPGLFMDFGCGTSRFCEELVFHGYKYVLGVDKDLSAIAFQRQQPSTLALGDYLQFVPMDALQWLLLPDRSCDFIMSKATLDQIAAHCVHETLPHELLTTLNEMIRCLKPGGILMAVVYSENMIEDLQDDNQHEEMAAQECMAERLMTSWWKWKHIRSLLNDKLTLVRQYNIGRPRLIDGKKTKPYKVLVWQRKETKRDRLQRLVGELIETNRQKQEYETRLWLHHKEHERATEELQLIHETRQMILEDEQSRLEQAKQHETENIHLRQERRKAFYRALLEEERQQMNLEDQAALYQQKQEQDMNTFVQNMIFQAITLAIDLVIVKEAEIEKRQRQQAAEANKALNTSIKETQMPPIIADLAHPSVQTSTLDGNQRSTERTANLDKETEATTTAVTTAATETVASIISTAMTSVTSPPKPKPNLETSVSSYPTEAPAELALDKTSTEIDRHGPGTPQSRNLLLLNTNEASKVELKQTMCEASDLVVLSTHLQDPDQDTVMQVCTGALEEIIHQLEVNVLN